MLDRAALLELFDYTTFTWATYGRTLGALPPDAFTREIQGSGWPALKDALFHIAVAWDDWLCAESGQPLQQIELTGIRDWAQLDELRQRMRALLRGIIDGSSDDQMNAPAFVGVPNPPTTASRADLIAHMLLHERGHHGDISTLLHALGAPPSTADYLVYIFFRDRKK
jgi:uncharacterized damage-inducible protein DinB